jgi:hypothetical protein
MLRLVLLIYFTDRTLHLRYGDVVEQHPAHSRRGGLLDVHQAAVRSALRSDRAGTYTEMMKL